MIALLIVLIILAALAGAPIFAVLAAAALRCARRTYSSGSIRCRPQTDACLAHTPREATSRSQYFTGHVPVLRLRFWSRLRGRLWWTCW